MEYKVKVIKGEFYDGIAFSEQKPILFAVDVKVGNAKCEPWNIFPPFNGSVEIVESVKIAKNGDDAILKVETKKYNLVNTRISNGAYIKDSAYTLNNVLIALSKLVTSLHHDIWLASHKSSISLSSLWYNNKTVNKAITELNASTKLHYLDNERCIEYNEISNSITSTSDWMFDMPNPSGLLKLHYAFLKQMRSNVKKLANATKFSEDINSDIYTDSVKEFVSFLNYSISNYVLTYIYMVIEKAVA